MNGLRLETRFSGSRTHEFRRLRQIEVHQFSATGANCMIVSVRLAVIATGAVAEVNFVDEAGLFQIAR